MIKMDVINNIINNKKKSLEISKNKLPLEKIKKEVIDKQSTNDKKFRFQEVLKDNSYTKLITEFKPASPSMGDISHMDIKDVISIYDKENVDMISILTEESYFKSNLENFKKATKITNKPLLRKDFVIDEYMIYEAVNNNASCVLLISNICPDIEEYLGLCNDLKIDALVECHTKEEVEKAGDYGSKIIGINNRNLNDFTINLETTKNLRKYVKGYLISESGVKTPEDAKLLKSYGADAILIGTSVLNNENKTDIEKYINELTKVLKN